MGIRSQKQEAEEHESSVFPKQYCCSLFYAQSQCCARPQRPQRPSWPISSASNIKTAQSSTLVPTQSVIYILRIEGFSGYAALLTTKGVKIPEARQTFAVHDHTTHRLWTKVIFS
jgi:hypothetical protein